MQKYYFPGTNRKISSLSHCFSSAVFVKTESSGTSLVVQWLRICLSIFHRTRKKKFNLYRNKKAKAILRRKNRAGGIILPDFRLLLLLLLSCSNLQSCPTLCNPIDGSPPGSTAPGILQARTLEWVAISFSIIAAPTANPGNAICLAWA